MKIIQSALAALTLLSLGSPLTLASSIEEAAARTQIQPMGSTNLNRFGLSYRMGFNISAEFKHLGGYAPLSSSSAPQNPNLTPNGQPYNYDNGYIYPDNAGGHAGFTYYYGYLANTTMRPGGAPTQFDLYRSSSASTASSSDNNGDPQHGLEFTYNRQLGRFKNGSWGLEAGVSFADITISDGQSLQAAAVRNTDIYQTGGGAVLKPAPFAGNANGPPVGDPGWPLVGLSPVNPIPIPTINPNAAMIAGHREFDAQMFTIRFGPYLDLPLNERWMFSLSGGMVVTEVSSDYRFDQTVTLDPSLTLIQLPGQNQHISGSHDDWLIGAYVGGTISYAINEHIRVFAGAQWQYTGDYTHSEAGQEAVLKLGSQVFVPIGVSYSF
jgi:hypothetical protein